ncbi:MAG: TonB-dependent receptor [Flavisolibacter sp.]|nr:TonB-dependent receptor [Flavisolibacter sp.]MBD0374340.1 TonB-dependent receptor [Flavisolibacter sp.]
MKYRRLLHNMALLMLLLISTTALAQDRMVTGRVTDTSGTGIPNVTVTISGQQKGTSTASNGSFSIAVPANATTLVFSSVGFATQEVPISGNAVEVIMRNVSGTLNEVVIVGYGTQRRRDLTGSIATVTAKDFQKGVITTPEQLIAGKVAGVQITSNSGAPGAGSRIRIRGGASLAASNDPLIVLDGVPLSNSNISGAANPLALINPNDIESFNILKDASATAIYGSRASNGVIIITTKKGGRGKPVFNFSTQLSAATNTKQVEVLSADQFRNLINAKGNATQKALLGSANTNWQDEIYRTAFAEDNNLSVRGSLNKMPYRVSVGFLNQDGVLRTSNLKRASASLNLSPRFFNDHLRVDVNLKGALTKSTFANESAIGTAVIFDPTQPVYSNAKRFGGFFEWVEASTSLPNANAPRNPLGLLMMREDKGTAKRSIGNIQFDYRLHFLPDLRANLNLGYDVSRGEGTVFVPDSAALRYRQRGERSQYLQKRSDKLLEFYLNYAKDIASINSRIDVMTGYSYQDFLTTNYNFPGFNAYGDTLPNTKPNFPFDKPQNTLISFYGRLNYSYKSRYLLTASLRRDGSSRFSPENRWGLFPAGAFAWNIKNEPFLQNAKGFTDLKLRLGYGVTGQQEGIGNYDYISYYALSNTRAQYQLGNTFYQMYRPGGYYANRKWEQTATYNIGLDYGFADNRIAGTLDVYYKKTKDLLNQIGQSAGTNFSNQIVANVGDMENRGVEFSINAQPVRSSDVSWDLNFNVTYNKNKITNLTIAPDPNYPGNQFGGISGGIGNTVQINSVGFPRSSFYVYQQVYDSTGKPLEAVLVDRNGDGTINEKDLYHYKSADPQFLFGFSTNVTYGKWNGGLTMRANVGNYVYNNVYSNLGRLNTVIGSSGVLNNASVSYLETGFYGGSIPQLISDYYVENASFLRMDNINVGYNVGRVLQNKANLRLSFNVQNVFTITKYKGLDPEISSGIDNNFYPRPVTFVLGLGLDF